MDGDGASFMTNAMTQRHQRKKPGKRRELPPMPDIDAVDGPKMAGLPSDRHRAFVRALYEVPPGFGFGVKAAKMSGWGCETSTAHCMAVIASKLMHDERVLEAIHEEDRKRIRASAPRAIRALSDIIENPDSKDHVRGIGMILDRTHGVQTTHVVSVEHRASASMEATAQVMARILELSERAMIDAPKMIDVTPTPEKSA
jgi:hypothetical protein